MIKSKAKKVLDVAEESSSPEVEVVVSESTSTTEVVVRDEEFYKKHTGAREDVIYG